MTACRRCRSRSPSTASRPARPRLHRARRTCTCASAADDRIELVGHARSRSTARRPTSCSARSPSTPARTASACMLTGMGDDGAQGLLALRQRGGRTLAQDEASCAVYGMPRPPAVSAPCRAARSTSWPARCSGPCARWCADDGPEPCPRGRGRPGGRPAATGTSACAPTRPCAAACAAPSGRRRRPRPGSAAYVEPLAGDAAALQDLFNRVTVQETGFFRHPEHFEVLARHVLPALPSGADLERGVLQRPGALQPGDDARRARRRRQRARDRPVDRRVAPHARPPLHDRELTGLRPAGERHLTPRRGRLGGRRRSGPGSARVHRNLLDPLPPEVATCQVVFCRNVLIYFTPEHAAVRRPARRRPAAGAHAVPRRRRVDVARHRPLRAVHVGDTFVYRQRTPAAPLPRPWSRPGPRPGRRQQVRAPRRPAATPRPRSAGARRRAAPPGARPPPSEGRLAGRTRARSTGRPARTAGQHAMAAATRRGGRMFRQWTYLEPDDPLAHFHLGLALEAAGDRARRSGRSRPLAGPGRRRPRPHAAGLGGYAATRSSGCSTPEREAGDDDDGLLPCGRRATPPRRGARSVRTAAGMIPLPDTAADVVGVLPGDPALSVHLAARVRRPPTSSSSRRPGGTSGCSSTPSPRSAGRRRRHPPAPRGQDRHRLVAGRATPTAAWCSSPTRWRSAGRL